MSRLDELISELCPNGIEYKQLGDVCKIETGRLNANAATENGKYLFFTTAKEVSHIDHYRWDTEALLIAGNANVGDVKHYIGKFEAYQRTYVLTEFIQSVSVRFLYFVLCNNLKSYLNTHKNSAAMTYIVLGTLQNFSIPIPPLPVQHDIVRLLDSITELTVELTAKLTAELTARQKQYQYYVDSLFSKASNNVVPLASLGTITRGKRFVHADSREEGVPCIHYGELYTYYGVHAKEVRSHIREELRLQMRYASKNDVIIVGAGENKEDIGVGVAWEGDFDVAVHDACYTLKHRQVPKYIAYFLRTSDYHNQIKRYVSEGKICSFSAESLGKIMIPLPNLEIQQRIAEQLSKFDALYNDITSSLSTEIAARQKQYEFYRDRLLSFK